MAPASPPPPPSSRAPQHEPQATAATAGAAGHPPASVDDLVHHLYYLTDPHVQREFEPSHLTREWLDSLPLPPGCSARPEPSSNAEWALVEQWRIAAGTIRYYAQLTRDRWYDHQQHWAAAAAAAAATQAAQYHQQPPPQPQPSGQAPSWGTLFEADVRAEQSRLFGSAPLPDRVAAAAAADAAFLDVFGGQSLYGHHEFTTDGRYLGMVPGTARGDGHGHGHGQGGAEWISADGEADDDDEYEDDEDYEDEEDEEDEGDDGGREFSFPIDLTALAKSAGMPFPSSATAAAGGKGGAGSTPSTYEDIVNRLAQAQQGQGANAVGGLVPADLLQLATTSDGGAASGSDPMLSGILSDTSDPLTLGPASLPSLMAAISELEQCVARLSLEASEARSLQRRMRDELGGAAPPGPPGASDQEQHDLDEREQAALERKKARNRKKKEKKRAKALAAAAAEGQDGVVVADGAAGSGGESDSAPGAAGAPREEQEQSEAAAPAANGAQSVAAASSHQQSNAKKEDGDLIKALQSVSMLDRRADEYRERLRVLKEQIHHHAALADALAATSAPGGTQPVHAAVSNGPVLHSGTTVASATVPLYYDGTQGQQAQVVEYGATEEGGSGGEEQEAR